MLKRIIAVLAAGFLAASAATVTASAATNGVPKNIKAEIVALANQCKKYSPPKMILGSESTSCGLYGPKKQLDYVRKHVSAHVWASQVAADRQVIALCGKLKPMNSDGALLEHDIKWDAKLGIDFDCYWGASYQKPTIMVEVSLAAPDKPFDQGYCNDYINGGHHQTCLMVGKTENLYDPINDSGPWELHMAVAQTGVVTLKRWLSISTASETTDYNVFTALAIGTGLFPPPHTDG